MNIKETNKGLGFYINPLGKQIDEFKNRIAQENTVQHKQPQPD